MRACRTLSTAFFVFCAFFALVCRLNRYIPYVTSKNWPYSRLSHVDHSNLILMQKTEILVSASEIGKSFSSVRAVDGISFEVKRGQIFSLLGPNGAGKSTLVRMLIGMLPADQGGFAWHDPTGQIQPLNRSQIGYLPEDRGLYKDQKVQATLEYFGALRGLSSASSRKATKTWMARLEIEQYANSKLETLSKGNQQKVQIATAVLHQPEFVVLDEPFSGLDPINQELMLGLIREIRDSGATVLLSAHQLNLVERMADHVLLMARGREVLSGSVEEIRRSPYGGKSIHVEFDAAISREIISNLRNMNGILEVTEEQANAITVHIHADQNQTEWLNKLDQLGTIRSFHSGATSLHDIYLRVGRQT